MKGRYRGPDAHKNGRSVDQFLSLLYSDHLDTLALLETGQGEEILNPEVSELSIVKSCTYNMGNSGERRFKYMCTLCRILNYLTEDPKREIELQAGKRSGDTLIVQECKRLGVVELVPSIKAHQGVHSHSFGETKYTYATSDCVGAVLISWILEDVLGALGLPYLNIDGFFVCNGNGYMISFKFPEEEPVVESGDEIVLQVLILLKALKSLHFNPGEPTLSGLHISNEPAAYEYDGIVCKSNVTVRLQALKRSSLVWHECQMIPKTTQEGLLFMSSLSYEEKTFTIEAKIVEALHSAGVTLPISLYVYTYILSINREYPVSPKLLEALGLQGVKGTETLGGILRQLEGMKLPYHALEIALDVLR